MCLGPLQTSTCSELTGPCFNKVTSFHPQSSTASFPSLLSVKFRILFKISLLTYKTLREKQPVYLHSVLATSLPSCSLRGNKDNSLSVPRVKTNTGTRAFNSCVPSFWNNLLLSVYSVFSVATFKKHLKTHLLDLAFTPYTPRHPTAC